MPDFKPKKIPAKSVTKSPTSWEPVAVWYDELLSGTDTYQSQVILPNLLRIVSPKGKKIIDIACGQGFFSRAFAEAEATEVLGLDISKELIEIARKHESENLQFDVAPASDLKPADANTYDTALIVLALQNIKEMNESLKEAARVLTKNGELVIVLNHPAFRIPKGTAWGFDEATKTQFRRVDKYGRPFTIDIDMTPGGEKSTSKIFTKSFHRPLQDYFKALSGAGFVVTGLEEWISHKKSEPGPRAEAEDNARKEFPMFLTIVARKAH